MRIKFYFFIALLILALLLVIGCTPSTLPSQPNLMILGVDNFSRECVVGSTSISCKHTIVFTIANVGSIDAGMFEVLVKIDPALSQQTYVANTEGLEAHDSITLTATIVGENCFDPDCSIEIIVDPMDVIDEYDEDDNVYSKTYTDVGFIDIRTDPPRAKVYLNEVDTGLLTPVTFIKDIGSYAVKLDKYHYKIYEDTIDVNCGQSTYIDVTLEYAPTQTYVCQSCNTWDATVTEDRPNLNWGDSSNLRVGTMVPYDAESDLSHKRWRAYIKFPVSLPENARMINAFLMLYQDGLVRFGSLTVGLYRVTGWWTSALITWNNQPTSSPEAEVTCDIDWTPGMWRYWRIDDLFKGWLDGSINNHGVLLKDIDEETEHTVVRFRSTKYNFYYNDYFREPKLSIDYYLP